MSWNNNKWPMIHAKRELGDAQRELQRCGQRYNDAVKALKNLGDTVLDYINTDGMSKEDFVQTLQSKGILKIPDEAEFAKKEWNINE